MSARPWMSLMVLVSASLPGCVTDEPSEVAPESMRDDAELRHFTSEQWLGTALGLPAPRVLDMGPLARRGERGKERGFMHADEPEEGYRRVATLRNGREYLLDIPYSAELAARVEQRLDALLDRAEADTADLDPQAGDKGISGNSDGRKRFGIAEGFSKNDWVAAIGLMTPRGDPATAGCTATLISSDVVLTAAHCVFSESRNGGPLTPAFDFHPRADRSQAVRFPWGTWSSTGALYYDPHYVNAGCYKSSNNDSACRQSDWALVRVARPVDADGMNLFMRYKVVASSNIAGLKNRGYANCDSPQPPPYCVSHTLFGDPETCSILLTGPGDDSGYSETLAHSCDTNPGHSGSPMYYYDATNRDRPTIVGVHISDGAVHGDFEGGNWMRHLTPSVVETINSVLSGSTQPL